MRPTILILLAFLLPVTASAATPHASFAAAQSLLLASSTPGNAYAAGASIVVAAPIGGDLSAFGGSIIAAAPVSGNELLVGGSVRSRGNVRGDLEILGGSISVEEPVAGDLVAGGITIRDTGRAEGSVFIIAATVALSGGAGGPVTVYGNNVSLEGDFAGDVTVVASGHVSLAAGTVIGGKLTYQSPEEALIPASATIRGGVTYTNASYLPDIGTSRILSFISIGLFLLVRVLGALILAGLLAGLFPRLAERLASAAISMRPTRILLTTLLGFAVFVVTPVLSLMLALTFVGVGIAFLFFVSYVLIILLALLYAGILVGSLFARRFMHRESVLWTDGVLGMLVLSIVTLIPYLGLFVLGFLTAFSAGSLLGIFFRFAFPHEVYGSDRS